MRLPMARCLAWLFCCAATAAQAQPQTVHVPSLDGPPATSLSAYLFPAPGEGRHPAMVFLHGCGGLYNHAGRIESREREWARRLNDAGITVLMVDSLGSRDHGEMCSPAHFVAAIYRARAYDAYAALRYLQALPEVRADRVGVMGWSQGGGTLLNTIRATSPARPASLPDGDFRAAVAFYPASCNTRRQGGSWASPVPLLALIGARDVWTPLAPCQALMNSLAEGTEVSLQAYPNAYHDFDWPDMPVHEVPAFRTRDGVVPIEGTDPEARDDAQQRVMAFLTARLLAP